MLCIRDSGGPGCNPTLDVHLLHGISICKLAAGQHSVCFVDVFDLEWLKAAVTYTPSSARLFVVIVWLRL